MFNYFSRFAPTPSGEMHVGHVRIMIYNFLECIQNSGRFLLRIDDTDTKRCKREYEDSVYKTLKWLGITEYGIARQSERHEIYNSWANKLKETGAIYPCFETEDELSIQRNLMQKQSKPYIYNRASLALSREEIAAKTIRPHWRFKLNHDQVIAWNDGVRGNVTINPTNISDPVVIRNDGSFTYFLPSVIDDAEFKIEKIIRGEDHVTNTAAQIQMFQALGAKLPQFAHIPLIFLAGKKLSKRNEISSITISSIVEEGEIQPEALTCYLLSSGYSGNQLKPQSSVKSFAADFQLKNISNASFFFDELKLNEINLSFLKSLQYSDIASRLSKPISEKNESLWLLISQNIKSIRDLNEWSEILSDNRISNLKINDKDLLTMILNSEIPENWHDKKNISNWIDDLAKKNNKSKKEIMMSFRNALLGRYDGPPIAFLLQYIGRETFLKFVGKFN